MQPRARISASAEPTSPSAATGEQASTRSSRDQDGVRLPGGGFVPWALAAAAYRKDLRTGDSMSLALRSRLFEEGGDIPRKYTCDGEDVSPPLAWSGVPEEARSLARPAMTYARDQLRKLYAADSQ